MSLIYNPKFSNEDKTTLFMHSIFVLFILLLNYKFNVFVSINDSSIYGSQEIYDPIIIKYIILNYGNLFPNFFSFVILPFLSFLIFVLIFYKFIPILWAVSISLLSILQSNEAPLRDFILLKININDGFANLALTNFPYPSLSIFLFLVFIYTTLNINLSRTYSIYNNYLKIIFVLFLWSILIHIQPLDGVLGFLFAFVFLNINFFRLYKFKSFNFFYIFLIFIILIFNFFIIYSNINFSKISPTGDTNSITFYFIIFYLLLPVFLLAILFYLQKIDLSEIFFKFLNIFILIFIELFLVLILKIYNLNFINHITSNRSTVFFLHFFYYIPFVYYLIRPVTNLDKNQIFLYLLIKNNLKNISFFFLNFFSLLIYFNSIFIIFK